jgi:hypothetical protein
MKKQKHHKAFAAFAVIMLCTLTSQASIWRVNNNPNYTQGCNHCFSSLQAANDTSIVMAGDTIHLEASANVYLGSATVNETTLNKRLVILGPGYFLNQNLNLQKNAIAATVRKLNFSTNSDYSIVKGVSFDWGSNIYGVEIHNASHILIESCYFGNGFRFFNSNPISDITIKKCYISGAIGSTNAQNITNILFSNCYIGFNVDLYQAGYSRTGEISHCVFLNSATFQINSNIVFYNNIVSTGTFSQINNGITNVHDNIFIPSPPAWLVGGNNYSESLTTVFPSTGSQDSILNVNSIGICPVCYTALPGNATFGMFGGADPYRLSGIPNIPAIYQLQSPPNVLQGGTINVNIGTRSND